MAEYGTWVSYGGAARIWLALVLLGAAAAVAGTGFRFPATPAGSTGRRVSRKGLVVTLLVWVAAIAAWPICVAVYLHRYLDAYRLTSAQAAPPDRIAPVTFTAVAVVFVIILVRSGGTGFGWWTRLSGAVIAALAAPLIFELPFDLIVMARTYPPIPPDPAGYRALFFVPLFLIEITTMVLLLMSPLTRPTRLTFLVLALMLGVFAIWALQGFGYPADALPTTLNIVSKLIAFIVVLTLVPLRAPAAPDSAAQIS